MDDAARPGLGKAAVDQGAAFLVAAACTLLCLCLATGVTQSLKVEKAYGGEH